MSFRQSNVSLPAFMALLFLVSLFSIPVASAQDFSNLSWTTAIREDSGLSTPLTSVDALNDVFVYLTVDYTSNLVIAQWSTDGGGSWEEESFAESSLSFHTPQILILNETRWTIGYLQSGNIVVRTTEDAGSTWTETTVASATSYEEFRLDGIQVGTETWEVIGAHLDAASTPRRMFHSDDRWATSTGPTDIGANAQYNGVGVAVEDLSTAYVTIARSTNDIQVYKTTDTGSSWSNYYGDGSSTLNDCNQGVSGGEITSLSTNKIAVACQKATDQTIRTWDIVSAGSQVATGELLTQCTKSGGVQFDLVTISSSSFAGALSCRVSSTESYAYGHIVTSDGTAEYSEDIFSTNGSADFQGTTGIGYSASINSLLVSYGDFTNNVVWLASSNEGDCPSSVDGCYKDFSGTPVDLDVDWNGEFVFVRDRLDPSTAVSTLFNRFSTNLTSVNRDFIDCNQNDREPTVSPGQISVTQDEKFLLNCQFEFPPVGIVPSQGTGDDHRLSFYNYDFTSEDGAALTPSGHHYGYVYEDLGPMQEIRAHSIKSVLSWHEGDRIVFTDLTLAEAKNSAFATATDGVILNTIMSNTVRGVALDDSPSSVSNNKIYVTGAFGTKIWGYSGVNQITEGLLRGNGIAAWSDNVYITYSNNLSRYALEDTGLSFEQSNTTYTSIDDGTLKVSKDGGYLTFIDGDTAYIVQSNDTTLVTSFTSPSGNDWTEVMLDAANNYLYGIDGSDVYSYQVTANTTYFGVAASEGGVHIADPDKFVASGSVGVVDETTGTAAGGFVIDGGDTFFGVSLQPIADSWGTSLTAFKWLTGLFLIVLLSVKFGAVIGIVGAILGAVFGFMWAGAQGFIPLWALFVMVLFSSYLLGRMLFSGGGEG